MSKGASVVMSEEDTLRHSIWNLCVKPQFLKMSWKTNYFLLWHRVLVPTITAISSKYPEHNLLSNVPSPAFPWAFALPLHNVYCIKMQKMNAFSFKWAALRLLFYPLPCFEIGTERDFFYEPTRDCHFLYLGCCCIRHEVLFHKSEASPLLMEKTLMDVTHTSA